MEFGPTFTEYSNIVIYSFASHWVSIKLQPKVCIVLCGLSRRSFWNFN